MYSLPFADRKSGVTCLQTLGCCLFLIEGMFFSRSAGPMFASNAMSDSLAEES